MVSGEAHRQLKLQRPVPADRVRVKLTVAYDGTGFYGFARNQGVRTVEEVLSEALARLMQHRVKLTCAGRTDRGVHARGQVVSFDADAARVKPARMVRSLNRMCRPDIAVSSAQIVADDFDARHDCTARVYRYRVLNSVVPDPLAARFSWHVEAPLDVEAMRDAAELLVGVHDFSSFCRRNRSRPSQSLLRTVHRVAWWRERQSLVFEIEGRSFCHQMVRSVVALLVAIGHRTRPVTDVARVMAARDRSTTPSPAPPQGLTLWSTHYTT